jgi:hypothetical protein
MQDLLVVFALAFVGAAALALMLALKIRSQDRIITTMMDGITLRDLKVRNMESIVRAYRCQENWRRLKEKDQARVDHQAILDEIDELVSGAEDRQP